jgi:bis(5'-nucleosyl)-tetraphosphatase (symmetrical)
VAPWFETPNRKTKSIPIVFGHWSTLGLLNHQGVIGIDTGCVWGGTLTAIDLNFLETTNPKGLAGDSKSLIIKTVSVAGYDHPLRM